MSDLRIVGPFSATTGYAHMTRAVLSLAINAGFRVQAVESDYRIRATGFVNGTVWNKRLYRVTSRKKIPDFQFEEIQKCKRIRIPLSAPTVFIQLPEALEGWNEYSSGPRIGWTMCEGDRLNPHWARGLSGVDLLLSPSRFCKEVFKRQAGHIPCEVVPLPVDYRMWSPSAHNSALSRWNLPGFLFFSVFSTIPRKGWPMLMQAFAEEFLEDDAGLIVKPGRSDEVAELANSLNMMRRRVEAKGGSRGPGTFYIHVLTGKFTDEDLGDYYRAADCYALPSAEGFGLPFVEAALCGVPSVALDGGGAADVVDEKTGYLVPHTMKPLIGQLPHVYDSTTLFPVCGFGDLRKTLRRAYEEEKSSPKGDAARRHALKNFTPHSEALKTKFRNVVEYSETCHKLTTRMWFNMTPGPVEFPPPKYVLCIGDGFGDAMACYGNAKKISAPERGEYRFIHYGYSKGVGEFLRQQANVGDVIEIEPESREKMMEVINDAGGFYNRDIECWLPEILKGTDINPLTVSKTHIHWSWGAWPVFRPDKMVLSEEAEQWAKQMRAELGEFILVQPYSTNSVGIGEHWFGWPAFLRWLIDRCESSHLLVFCGLNEIHGLDRPGVVNLIGKTPSMQHVLALCGHARGVISTCNAVANWTAITGTQGFVIGNGAIPREDCFWRRFLSTKNNQVHGWETTVETMQKAAEKWIQARAK